MFKKYKKLIIILSIIIILIATIVIYKKYTTNNQNWKKLGYEQTEEQTKNLKIYEFGMELCDACEQVEPVYNKIKEDYKETFDFEYIDVNMKLNITNKYNISLLPTFLIVDKTGKAISRITGAITYEEFVSFINKGIEVYDGLNK